MMEGYSDIMILSEGTSCAISDTLQDIPEVCIPIRAVAAGFEAADLNRCGGGLILKDG